MGWIPQNNDNWSLPCTYNANVDDCESVHVAYEIIAADGCISQ